LRGEFVGPLPNPVDAFETTSRTWSRSVVGQGWDSYRSCGPLWAEEEGASVCVGCGKRGAIAR
jgi:diadenosine tetraphosphatase ApaH/serine/threonine PP2A family protein phosphatase